MKRLSLALACVFVALAAMAANDAWLDHYNRGVAAVNAGNWASAADSLQKAIADKPTESPNALARKQFITYVPHFWLGIAKYNLGDNEGALREFRISEEHGVVQNTQYYPRLRDWVARANSQTQQNAVNAASDSRKAADAALSKALSGQVAALSAGGDRTETYRAAQRKLKEALDLFNKAGTDVRAFQRAADTAGEARELFATAAEEGKKLKASRIVPPRPVPVQPTPQPQKPVEVPVAQAPPPPAPKVDPPVPVESEALVSTRIALQRYRRNLLDAGRFGVHDRAVQFHVQNSMRDLDRMSKQVEAKPNDAALLQRTSAILETRERDLAALIAKAKMPAPPQPAGVVNVAAATPTGTVRSQLQSAYRAYATGRLDDSEALLSKLVATKDSAAEAYLLRGVTRYTRAMLSRNPDALLPSATADFRSALKLNRSLRLDPAAFSPKLIAFFERQRK